MPFDWKKFFELAKFLGKPNPDLDSEAGLRSSVSRAYFSCFCYLRNYARDRGGFRPFYHDEDHARVREHFKGLKKRIADNLQDLRIFGNLCDYTDDLSGLEIIQQNALKAAEEIFKDLN